MLDWNRLAYPGDRVAAKILFVDDDLDTVQLMGIMFTRQGYQFTAASTGQQALSLAHSLHPDLVLLDIMMPDMDGIEVLRTLRADPATQKIPVILFTAKAYDGDRRTGLEAGADDYLTKPVESRKLFERVKALLERECPPAQQASGG